MGYTDLAQFLTDKSISHILIHNFCILYPKLLHWSRNSRDNGCKQFSHLVRWAKYPCSCSNNGAFLVEMRPIFIDFSHFHLLIQDNRVNFNQPWLKKFLDRGNYSEIRAKLHWWHSKIYFSISAGPIWIKLGAKHPWVKLILCSIIHARPRSFSRIENSDFVFHTI